MKMTLKCMIEQAQEILSYSKDKHGMDSNDVLVVYYASAMHGSTLSKKDNKYLMNRNAIPKKWHSEPERMHCVINFNFKKAYAQIVKYTENSYDITPGRLQKLMDILSAGKDMYSIRRTNLSNNESVLRYLRNLNNLRRHYREMTAYEIYYFSFDMTYDFLNNALIRNNIPLSLLIMYWIQRECDLIPLAVRCSKDEYVHILGTQSDDEIAEKKKKEEFRVFMRDMLIKHLNTFIKNKPKDSPKSTSRDRILKLIKDNPHHTAKTMASCLGLSVKAVQKQISKLKSENRLMRIGPDHGGKWKIPDKKITLTI